MFAPSSMHILYTIHKKKKHRVNSVFDSCFVRHSQLQSKISRDDDDDEVQELIIDRILKIEEEEESPFANVDCND